MPFIYKRTEIWSMVRHFIFTVIMWQILRFVTLLSFIAHSVYGGDVLLSHGKLTGTLNSFFTQDYKTSLAVDGQHDTSNTAGAYAYLTYTGNKPASLWIDLLYPSRISKFKIYVVGQINKPPVIFQVGPSLENFTTCTEVTTTHAANTNFEVDVKCTGRFVHIQAAGQTLALAEVEVYGEVLHMAAKTDRILSHRKPTGTRNAILNLARRTSFMTGTLVYQKSDDDNCATALRMSHVVPTDLFVNLEMTAQISRVKLFMPTYYDNSAEGELLIIQVGHSLDDLKLCYTHIKSYKKGEQFDVECKGVGRYVSVHSANTKLTICRIEVYGHQVPDVVKEYNMAHNKIAGTNSKSHSNYYLSHYAIDGRYDQRYKGGTVAILMSKGAIRPNWWVNLGKMSQINRIKIWTSASTSYAPKIRNMLVKTGSSLDDLKLCQTFEGPAKPSDIIEIKCSAKGRYVYLEIPDSELNLSEVEVWGHHIDDFNDEVISMHKPAGTFGYVPKGWPAEMVTDGFRDAWGGTTWRVAHSKKRNNIHPHFYINLEATAQITRVRVLLRDTNYNQIQDLTIKVGHDLEHLKQCAVKSGGTTTPSTEWTLPCKSVGQYVWIESHKDEIDLVEVEVYGKIKKECLEKPVGYNYNYEGTMSVTKSGHTCQRWNTNHPHTLSKSIVKSNSAEELESMGNFCRQPKGDNERKPWCYTTNQYYRYEQCEIPAC